MRTRWNAVACVLSLSLFACGAAGTTEGGDLEDDAGTSAFDVGGGGGGGGGGGDGGLGLGGGSGLDVGSGSDVSTGTDTLNKCGKTLTGTLRDVKKTHADFEYVISDDRGVVESKLGSDGKPVFASGSHPTMTTKFSFDQWYRDVPGENVTIPLSITLKDAGGGVYTYDNETFFPIDGKGFGNEGNAHNFHFTFELHTTFLYGGGEKFKFTGDDDLWAFLNQKLAIDLGGVHGAESQEITLDARAAELGIVKGSVYQLDVFSAERHTTESHFRIDTTLDFVDCGGGIK